MDTEIIIEIWDGFTDILKEKDKNHSLTHILKVLEEHGLVSETDFEELIHESKYFKEAVQSIYKSMGEDHEDEDDPWEQHED